MRVWTGNGSGSWAGIVAGLLLIAFTTSCPAASPSGTEINRGTPLTVVSDDNYPPYVFRDSNGVLNGYLVDLWKLWETKTGVRADLVATDWQTALQSMAAGRADVIDTIFRTEQREKTLDFTAPYEQIHVSIYSHAGIGGITNLNTLHGFSVGVKAGDACIDTLRQSGIESLHEFSSYEALVLAAVAGQIKVFCLDEPPANYLLYRNQAERDFNKAFRLYTGEFHRAVKKGDAATLALLNRGFSAITESERQALHDKWMGSRLESSPYVRYLGYALLATALLGILLALWGMTLRRMVRQRASELAMEHARLRALLETIPDLVWLKDMDGVYLFCNSEFEKLYGAKEENIVGKTDYDFVDRQQADSFRHHDKMAVEAGKPTSNEEWLTFSADGRHVLVETTKTPMRDSRGKLIGVLGVARDITQRAQAEQAVRESEGLLRSFYELDLVGLAITAPDKGWLRVNQYLCNMLEYSEQELRRMSWAQLTYPEDLAADEAQFARLLANETEGYELEKRFLSRSGNVIPTRLVVRCVRKTDGSVDYVTAMVEDVTERKRAESELRASEERYRVAFRTSPDVININRVSDGVYLDVNEGFERTTGWSREEALNISSLRLDIWADPADRQHMIEVLNRDGFCENLQFRFRRKDGSLLTGLMSVHPIRWDGVDCVLSVTRDITERIRIEDALRQKEQYQRALLDNFPFAVWLKDTESRFLSVNREFARMFGERSPDEFSGCSDADIVSADIAERHQATDRMVQNSRQKMSVEEELQVRDHRKWFETYKAPVIDDNGELLGTVGFSRDISERKAAEDEIRRLAFYDSLTHLPNRRLLLDRLQQALASCTRSGKELAVLFIDLDNFKTLNDTLGHDIGDLLLKQVAERLASSVREGDTVARLGGDEFVIVLEDLSDTVYEAATQAEVVGEKILASLNQPYELDGHHCLSSPSIGIALLTGNETTIDDLMKRADVAMYQAKDAGRNTLRFFDPDMQAAVADRIKLEADLRKGLELAQLVLHYQPQVDGIGKVTGAEALVRWRHPQRGLVSPAEFIPLAEETGLIQPLGHWVLTTACRQLLVWAANPALAQLTLAVNVSARQFRQPDFVEHVSSILADTGADPQKLKLELTESLLLEDVENTIAKMNALKAIGVSFSLDDFGTGYSSLSYLKRLPLDQLKIDQSFIRDVLIDPNDAAIARTIVALAQSLSLSVIAEGVETEAQREFLSNSGCHACQGYLFSHPLPAEEFEKFVGNT
ncbi:MAG: PAS domain S-box protein [Sulfuritalea sp.]|nr:PAS domain S-box protein [Sulfuritalea sp.]